MKLRWQQQGFTIIEISIVLAIVGLAAAVTLAGNNSQVRTTSFTNSMDSLNSRLQDVRNQAVSSVDTTSSGGGISGASVVGKVVEFDPATPDQATVSTLVEYENEAYAATHGYSHCDIHSVPLTRGDASGENNDLKIKPGQPRKAIIFMRDSDKVYLADNDYSFTSATGPFGAGGGCSHAAVAPSSPSLPGGTPPIPQEPWFWSWIGGVWPWNWFFDWQPWDVWYPTHCPGGGNFWIDWMCSYVGVIEPVHFHIPPFLIREADAACASPDLLDPNSYTNGCMTTAGTIDFINSYNDTAQIKVDPANASVKRVMP